MGMYQNIIKFCVIVMFGTLTTDVFATVVSGEYNSANLPITETTIIQSGAVVSNATTININQSAYVHNYGTILSPLVNIDAARRVWFQNAGTVSDSTLIKIGTGAELFQTISSSSDINKIVADGRFDIIVTSNTERINLGDVVAIAPTTGGAIDIQDNSMLLINGTIASSNQIKISGNINILVNDVSAFADSPLIRNVYHTGTVNVVGNAGGVEYALESYFDMNNDLYVRVVRETDYTKIFDDVGGFLNNLRAYDSSDPLLSALDNATSVSQMQSIMANNFRFRPEILMRPVRVMNDFEIIDSDMSNHDAIGAISPLYIGAGEFSMYGARANGWFVPYDGLHVGVAAYGAMLDYSDATNVFSGAVYGSRINGRYDIDTANFMRGVVGATIATFDTGPIYDNGDISQNPTGHSIYGKIDYGHRFDIQLFDNTVMVAPFIGLGTYNTTVLSYSDTDTAVRIGSDVGYKFESGGIRYDYVLHARMDTATNIGIAVRMNVWSITDGAGGHIAIGLNNDDFYTSYEFSIGVGFAF